MKLKDIALKIDANLFGDADLNIKEFHSLKTASKEDLSFVLEQKYISQVHQSKAKAFITFKHLDGLNHQLVVKNPRKALALAIELFYSNQLNNRSSSQYHDKPISESAVLGESVKVNHFVTIGDQSTIGNGSVLMSHVSIGHRCNIGKNCLIYPNVTILDEVVIGDNCIIHSGAVIGSDGFSYAQDGKIYYKVPHIGTVELEHDVEIGANVTIDRACLDKTTLKSGTKIDNLVHIAHNCDIGHNCVIAAQSGMTGGTCVGDQVMIGGQVAIDNSEIGNNVIILGRSGVTKDLADASVVSGFPAQDHKQELKEKATLKKMLKRG